MLGSLDADFRLFADSSISADKDLESLRITDSYTLKAASQLPSVQAKKTFYWSQFKIKN